MARRCHAPRPKRYLPSPVLTSRARRHRKQPTEAERSLWERLRRRQLCGLAFRRQAVIGTVIADFYCAAVALVVEVDGEYHDSPEQSAKDRRRDAMLSAHGFRVLRVRNADILRRPALTIAKIRAAARV